MVDASITIQGEEKAATVPSGKLRFVGGFDLVAGETTILTLDFDAKKSVRLRGKMDPLLRPVVKLLVRQGDEEVTDAVVVSDIVDGGDTPPTPDPTGPTPSSIATVTEPPIPTPSLTPTATVRPAPTPTPTPTPTPIPTYNLVAKVTSEDGGYFAGAAASDFSLVAITGYATTTEGIDADERNLTFFDADGNLLAKVDIGGGSWGVAMTPDGSKTVAGSDDEQLYVFEGTTLVASGRPIGGNGQLRGMAISADGQYAVVGGFAASVHDLTAADPITPIFIDDTTDQLRGVDITPDGRYAAYGGRYGGNNMYMGIYDTQAGERVYSDTITYAEGINAELRMLAISDDGNRVVAGDWGGFVYYYVRPSPTADWSRVQSIEVGSRVYWIDMDSSGTLAAVGVQGSGVRLYELDDSSFVELWEVGGPGGAQLSFNFGGGQRHVSITRDGEFITAGTRGGGGRGGSIVVMNRLGEVVFTEASDAVQVGDIYLGPNGANPEVWFTKVSEGGERIVFASWGGSAYFYQLSSG